MSAWTGNLKLQKDVRLMWKGSSNQRVIDVQASLKQENPAVPVLHRQDYATGRRVFQKGDRMRRIARFYEGEQEQFTADFKDAFPACGQEQIAQIYDALKLPARATGGSAGYDFYAYTDRTEALETVKIPTGIRVTMQPEWVLHLYPRSGLGFKYRLQLNNTVGNYCSDYFNSDNEGHILLRSPMIPMRGKTLELQAGEGALCRVSSWNTELLRG